MGYKILVAEDDLDIIKILKLYLENENYEIFSVENGIDALEILEKIQIDLAVVDIMMPKMNGYELIKEMRKENNIPVIILSAKNKDTDKVLGLNLGADDYLTKPFSPLELIARIESNLRRYYQLNEHNKEKTEGKKLVFKELCLDTQTFSFLKNGIEIVLTPMEYKILACLLQYPGRIYTKNQIYECVNGRYFENDDNTMIVHISNLREKIEEDPRHPKYIKTVRGLGYKIEK